MSGNVNHGYSPDNGSQDNHIDNQKSYDKVVDSRENEERKFEKHETTDQENPFQALPSVNASKQDYSNEQDNEAEDKPRAVVNKLITIEPIVFLVVCAMVFQSATTVSLFAYKVCRVTYNYSEALCRDYSNDTEAAAKIEPIANNLGMYKTLIETIPAVFYSFFLGSWSDKRGRKFPIILPLIGYTCSAIGNMMFAYYIELAPQYMLISSMFVGLCGGMISVIMGCFSYITDITTVKNRTKRIAITDLALFFAMPIGMFGSAQVYGHWRYVPVFGISAGLYCSALLYSIFYLSETVHYEKDGRKCGAFVDLFDIENVKNNLKICTIKREGNKRVYVNLMIISMALVLFPMMGENVIMLYYVKTKFHWDVEQLGYYNAFSSLITIIGTAMIFKFLLKKYHVPDLILGIIGVSGIIIKSVIIALSFAEWMLYVGAAVTFFQFLGSPSVRSFASKLVAKDEVGKLFAVIASSEALAPILSTVAHAEIYNATRATFPGAAFLLSASLMIIPISIFTWIYFNMKIHAKYKRFHGDKEHGDCDP